MLMLNKNSQLSKIVELCKYRGTLRQTPLEVTGIPKQLDILKWKVLIKRCKIRRGHRVLSLIPLTMRSSKMI